MTNCELCGNPLGPYDDCVCPFCGKKLQKIIKENRKYPAIPYKPKEGR